MALTGAAIVRGAACSVQYCDACLSLGCWWNRNSAVCYDYDCGVECINGIQVVCSTSALPCTTSPNCSSCLKSQCWWNRDGLNCGYDDCGEKCIRPEGCGAGLPCPDYVNCTSCVGADCWWEARDPNPGFCLYSDCGAGCTTVCDIPANQTGCGNFTNCTSCISGGAPLSAGCWWKAQKVCVDSDCGLECESACNPQQPDRAGCNGYVTCEECASAGQRPGLCAWTEEDAACRASRTNATNSCGLYSQLANRLVTAVITFGGSGLIAVSIAVSIIGILVRIVGIKKRRARVGPQPEHHRPASNAVEA